MPITLNGSGTISGISTGGISDAKALAIGGMPSGSVIQYKSGLIPDINNRASVNSSTFGSTGIHVDITPTNANNKIIIDGRVAQYHDNSGITHEFRIPNGTT